MPERSSRAPERLSAPVVPLFPLPNVWLFPAVILPLHVFEERYRQMVEDSLDGPGRLVLGTIRAGHEAEAAGAPPIYPLAGLGEIGRHERLEDGRYNILLVGLQRVFVKEVPSERLYRKVEAYPAHELPITPRAEPELRKQLLVALAARTEELPDIPDEFSTGHLVDMLVLRMPLEPDSLNALYSELDTEKRALAALGEHARRPLSS
ncbi:MAG TPA: LON peptidase substrate-binding domain-containing protein [Planctomycetota bacterium]